MTDSEYKKFDDEWKKNVLQNFTKHELVCWLVNALNGAIILEEKLKEIQSKKIVPISCIMKFHLN